MCCGLPVSVKAQVHLTVICDFLIAVGSESVLDVIQGNDARLAFDSFKPNLSTIKTVSLREAEPMGFHTFVSMVLVLKRERFPHRHLKIQSLNYGDVSWSVKKGCM